MKYLVRTLGCKANLADSQQIEFELQKRGWMPSQRGETAELCIINSCTVTDEADRQSRKLASRLARENPGCLVVVTGCAAEVDPEILSQSKGINYIVGNRDKPKLVELLLDRISKVEANGAKAEILGNTEGYSEMASRHPMDREWSPLSESFVVPESKIQGQTSKTRMFLRIQEGCNSFCTYCVIPYGRGPSRSLDADEVIAQVRTLVRDGAREIVLTGTNLGDYGSDWGSSLERLIREILEKTSLERLRVSSLSPTEITDGILELAATDTRFCSHFHVSLQSGCDTVLKRMKRRYGAKEVRDCLTKIEAILTPVAPLGGPFVGMDVIVGFPGESEQEFEETLKLLKETPWMRLHVFPYSERAGTPATRLPGSVPQEVRQKRVKILNELSLKRLEEWHQTTLKQLNAQEQRAVSILGERAARGPDGTEGWVAGYTSNYIRVFAPTQGEEQRENQIFEVIPERVFVNARGGEAGWVGRVAQGE